MVGNCCRLHKVDYRIVLSLKREITICNLALQLLQCSKFKCVVDVMSTAYSALLGPVSLSTTLMTHKMP